MAERMLGAIKRVLQKMCPANISDWGLCLDQVLYGTTDVQVLEVNPPLKFFTVSNLDSRKKTKLLFYQVLNRQENSN